MESLPNTWNASIGRCKPLLFIAAVCFSVFLVKPESLVYGLERVGLMVVVVRGLKGHYDDFSEALDGKKNRR
jgi:hypothetical protein